MTFPFAVKPAHWWYWLNPRWWRRKKNMEISLAYVWETQNLEPKFDAAIRDALLTGKGQVLWNWRDK